VDEEDHPVMDGCFRQSRGLQGSWSGQIVRRGANQFAKIGKNGMFEQRLGAYSAAQQGVEPVANQCRRLD